jgi:hypothetical protein
VPALQAPAWRLFEPEDAASAPASGVPNGAVIASLGSV